MKDLAEKKNDDVNTIPEIPFNVDIVLQLESKS